MATHGSTPDSGGGGDKRKRVVAVSIVVLISIGIGIGLWITSSGPTLDPRRARTHAAPMVPEAEAEPLETPDAPVPRDELPAPVQTYLAQTVYPPNSGRLDQAGDILESNPRFERFKRVPGSRGSDPEITFLWTADAFRYTSDESVEVTFEAKQGGVPANIRRLVAFAQPESREGPLGAPIPLSFRETETGRIATLDLARELEDHHGFVALGVRYVIGDLAEQQEQIRVFVTPTTSIPAAFTGTFRDIVRNGSLEIEVGIEVYEAGFYRFDANLYGPAGEPVAWASFKDEVSRSDTAITLRFFGRVLHDLGVNGPYDLRQLRGYLFHDGGFPDRTHLRDYAETHVTRAFELAEFSEAEWDSAHRRQMVDLMMQDVEAGISLDAPAVARKPESSAPVDAPAP